MADTEIITVEERLEDIEYRRAFGSANIKLDLALALVEARRRMGIKQEQLAAMSGVSQPYIAKLESGEANPTVGVVGSLLAVIYYKLQIGVCPLVRAPEVAVGPKAEPSRCEDAVLSQRSDDSSPVSPAPLPSGIGDVTYPINLNRITGTSGLTSGGTYIVAHA